MAGSYVVSAELMAKVTGGSAGQGTGAGLFVGVRGTRRQRICDRVGGALP